MNVRLIRMQQTLNYYAKAYKDNWIDGHMEMEVQLNLHPLDSLNEIYIRLKSMTDIPQFHFFFPVPFRLPSS